MTAHTPGPWGAFGAELEGKVRAEQLLIQPAHQDDSNDFTNIIAELPWQHFTVTEREANARLIAAAPEMLEALEALLEALLEIGDAPAYRDARDIVRRVKGEDGA